MRTKEERKAKKQAKKQRIKQLPIYKKIIRYVLIAIIFFVILIIMLASVGTVAHAAGLVDETINTSNEYSKYGLGNYQLDFYVNNDWGWLPWNWSDGIGKSVSYGLYAITNFVWTISLYLSNATGYLVQEAYSLDFISKTVDSIGKNIQTIAGVTKKRFLYLWFLRGILINSYFRIRNLCDLHRTNQKRNHQSGTSCSQLYSCIHFICFFYCLCTRLYRQHQ